MDYAAQIEEIKNELQIIAGRVQFLEGGLMDVKQNLGKFEETVKHADKTAMEAKIAALEASKNSAQAVTLLSAATGVAGFVAKHGPRVIAALVGVGVYRGFVDANLGASLVQIFGG